MEAGGASRPVGSVSMRALCALLDERAGADAAAPAGGHGSPPRTRGSPRRIVAPVS
ncbi:hypothetical protein L332_02225 [Agrococcus pavilionensis RW1]|uniref:Uncharacterized protein n=1 Tax=Agrococcus pavilionensis RW1 TaxID=1330458 RepID=U1LLV8_9MICO|nr:hypothetical protein L332_02225 [Agrococcus pavilionensis RW1]